MLAALIVLSAVMASVFEWYRLQAARVEMQTAADAAALGGVREFIDDRFLAGEPCDLSASFALATDAMRNQALTQCIASSRDQAQQYAFNNGVFGDPVTLDANAANDPAGDILLGRLNCARDKVFYAGDLTVNGQPPAPLLVNAVRIHAHGTRDYGDSVCYRWRSARRPLTDGGNDGDGHARPRRDRLPVRRRPAGATGAHRLALRPAGRKPDCLGVPD